MKFNQVLLILCLSIWTQFVLAQNVEITAQSISVEDYPQLWDKFEYCELYTFSTQPIHTALSEKTESNDFRLRLGNLDWWFDIHPHDIRSASFQASTEVDGNHEKLPAIPSITYRGGLINDLGSDVSIAILNQMIMGRVLNNGSEYIIENLNGLIPEAPTDIYIVYETASVIPTEGLSCGVDEAAELEHRHLHEKDHSNDNHESDETESGSMACYEVIVSLACDAGYTNRHGGSGGAQGRMIGILNLVQTNFDNEFRDEISFVLGPSFTAIGTNPRSWNFATNSTILSTFRNWANGGGFGSTAYDVATLWTVQTFGGIIGTAYLNALCGGNRYNFCVDFTSNSDGLRDLQAHEIGHNFGFTHDPRGTSFIMTSGVFSSTRWSGQSKSQFNSRVPFSCMGPCSGGLPPEADFIATPSEGCKPQQVQFADQSSNIPTQWRWNFPGGTPSSSTQQNPLITYQNPGTYEVTLEASNLVGTDVEIKRGFIKIGDVPIAAFNDIVNQDEVIFIDQSLVYHSADYMYDFGDGNFSTDINPTHIYEKDGIYLVTLTVTTACGSASFQRTVEIVTPPEGEFSAFPTDGCVGTFVDFTNESSENVDSWAWKFESGQPATSNLENPTVKYDTAGTFEVTLVVSNSRYKDQVVKTGYITIDSSAVADFSELVDTLDVEFTYEGDHGRDFKWDFGDGGTSTLENPTHTYAKDSVYDVTLIAKNFCDEDTITQTISVGFLPTAGFSADKNEDCVTASISFTDESSDNTTRRLWKFEGGDPVSSTDMNPTVTYDQTGEYKVTLIAINGLGNDTLIEEKFITVLDDPKSEFDFTRNGFEITFNNTSEGGTSYDWDFGDGNTSTMESPTHTYGQDGDYQVVLITSNICGADTFELEVSLSNNPNANFTASETVGCAPMTVELQNLSSANSADFEWIFPGGNPGTTTEANPTVVYNNPGLYRVELIAKNGFGSDTIVKRDFIEVLDDPVADYNFMLSGFEIDFMEDSDFGKEFFWDFGDGATSTLADPTHVYSDEGIFDVVLIVRNICGEDTISKSIQVTPRPILGFNIDRREICKEDEVAFEDQSENDPTSWLWTFEGGTPMTSTDQNPVVTYEESGTYDVILEATNTFGTTIDTFQAVVRVFDNPLAEYTYEEQGVRVNFTNNSQEFGDITWDFGDGNTSTEFEPSHLYSLPGTYEVTLTVDNECGTDVYMEEITVRHRDITFVQLGPSPAPNPTQGLVTVTYRGPKADQVEIFISGIDGQINSLKTLPFEQGEMTTELDLSNYTPGTYMIFFKTNEEVKMSKVVVQD